MQLQSIKYLLISNAIKLLQKTHGRARALELFTKKYVNRIKHTHLISKLQPAAKMIRQRIAPLQKRIQKELAAPLSDKQKLVLKTFVLTMVPLLLVSILTPVVYIKYFVQEPLPMTLVKRDAKELQYRGSIIQREEGKYDVELETKTVSLSLGQVATPPENLMVYVDTPVEADKNINTDVVFVEDRNVLFESATLELDVKSGKKVNAVVRCESWNFDVQTGTCSNWQVTDIKPNQTGNTLAFAVDHFSAYAGAYLEVLNLQTNLTAGNVWEVRFNTYGQADLTVLPIEGTVYGTDVEFIEFFCGDTKYPASVYDGGKVFIKDYSCDGQLSRLVDRSVTPGPHKLQLTFGESTVVARNFACNVGTLDDTCEVSSANVITNGSTISGTGNLVIKTGGSLTTANGEAFTINMGGDVTIETGGSITGNLTDLIADNLTVLGSIDVSGKGNGSSTGLGQGTDGSSGNGGGGAGYGGAGGNGHTGVAGGAIYGSVLEPTDLGSGGGAASTSQGGAGGGAVKISVPGTVTVNGSVVANGATGGTSGGTNLSAGGGSGGSIYITSGTLAGSGTITANGGNGANQSPDGGAGGGGRIALYYTTRSHNGSVQASSGTGPDSGRDGAPGTIYEKPASQTYGNLTLNNLSKNAETQSQLPVGEYSFHDFTITGNTTFGVQNGMTATVTNAFNPSGAAALSDNSSTGGVTYPPLDLTVTSTMIIASPTGGKWPIRDLTLTSGGLTYTDNSNAFRDISVSAGLTLTGNYSAENVVLNSNTTTLNGDLTATNLTIETGAILTHGTNTTAQTNDLSIDLSGNLTLNGTGTINVNAKGYSASNGTGQGTDGSSNNGAAGGSYGGAGGTGNLGTAAGSTYDDYETPTSIGSGGGNVASYSGAVGGAGGGAAVITVDGTTTIASTAGITANGNAGTPTSNVAAAGGGSGGSIYLTTGTLTGSGLITANGGSGASNSGNSSSTNADGGGGGGGRVAVYYTTSDFSGTIQAAGGTGPDSSRDGAAGSVYEKPSAQTYGNYTIDNASRNADTASQLPAGTYTFHNFTITNQAYFLVGESVNVTITNNFSLPNSFYISNTSTTGAFTFSEMDLLSTANGIVVGGSSKWPFRDVLVNSGTLSLNGSYSVRNVSVASGATLAHASNSTTQTSDLRLTISGDLTLNGTATINVNARGFASSSGTGQGADGTGNNGAGGGGHGGAGGNGNLGALGGAAYGSSTNPVTIGSGGGNVASYGAAVGGIGGGAVILNVEGTTSIPSTASITANGNNGTPTSNVAAAGGGAGGTVYLVTETLTGSGSITANGGNGAANSGNSASTDADGGGGGGGRIVIFANNSTYTGETSVTGGTGPGNATDGGVGSSYIDYSGPQHSITSVCSTEGNICTAAGTALSPQEIYFLTSFTGTVTETETSIETLQISLKDATTSKWYNPTTNEFDQTSILLFDPTTIDQTLPFTGIATWTYNASGIPFEIDHHYEVAPAASNTKVSNTDTLEFIFSNSPPTVSNVSVTQEIAGSVTVNYDVTDNERSDTTIYLFYDIGTTLASGITTSADDITISGASYFPSSGTILVDDEMITYSSRTGTTLSGITRGALNTTIVSHDSGDIVSLLSSNTSGNVGTVNNGTSKSLTWNAKSDLNGFYSTTTNITVLSNDGASSQMVDATASADFILDVKDPTWTGQFTVDASQSDPVITIPCADDRTLQMKVGLVSDLSDVEWQTFDSSTTISAQGLSVSDPFTLYAQCKDANSNTSTLESAETPDSPDGMFFQDVSNAPAEEWREFVTWNVSDEPSAGFNRYIIYRKVNDGSYAQLTTISDRTLNYIIDPGLDRSSTYYYKVVTEDDQGNISYFSSVVSDQPEGVGGSDINAPSVTGVTSSLVSSTQATITWNTNELANSKVYYKASSSYPGPSTSSYTNSQAIAAMVTSHSVVLSGLTPNTKYYFLVESLDPSENSGQSASSLYTFTTANGPAISNVTVTQVFDTEATITWDTTTDSTSKVLYSTTSNLASPTTSSGGTDLVTTHSVTLTGLQANTQYYFKVQSTDGSSNTSEDTNVVNGVTDYYSFRTTQDTDGPVISSIDEALTSSDGITILWQTSELATSQVEWGTTSDLGEATTATSVYTIQHAVTLTELAANTTYYYKVVSVDKAGNTTSSSPVRSISTDEVAGTDTTSPEFSNVNVTERKGTTAKVTWLTNEDSDSFVKFGTSASALSTTLGQVETATTHSVTLTNLEPTTTYYFQLTGRDTDGNIGTSTTYSFTTTNELDGESVADDGGASDELMDTVVEIIEKASKSFAEKVLKALISNPNLTSLPENEVVNLLTTLSEKTLSAPTISGTEIGIEAQAQAAVVKWVTNKPANSTVAYVKESEYNPEATDPYTTEVGDTQTFITEHEVTVTGLEPNTTYRVQTRSKDKFGPVAASEDLVFTTESLTPEITDLSVGAKNETTVVMNWKTSIPTRYAVVIRELDTGEQFQFSNPSYLKVHQFETDTLSPGLTYAAEVTVTDEAGTSTTTPNIPFSAIETSDPPQISDLKVVTSLISGKVEKVQTIISWRTDKPASSIVYFEQGAKSINEETAQVLTDTSLKRDHIVVSSSFVPGQVYRYRVKSSDISGNAAASDDYTMITPKPKESVVDLIVNNVEDMFGFLSF